IVAHGLRRDPASGTEQRQPINSPLDYLIDWTGTRPRTKTEAHAVAARRRDKPWPIDDFFDIERGSTRDIFEDLTISEADWNNLLGLSPALVTSATPLTDLNGQSQRLSKRGARTKAKEQMYATWYARVSKYRRKEDGKRRNRIEIATKIADDPTAADPTNGRP